MRRRKTTFRDAKDVKRIESIAKLNYTIFDANEEVIATKINLVKRMKADNNVPETYIERYKLRIDESEGLVEIVDIEDITKSSGFNKHIDFENKNMTVSHFYETMDGDNGCAVGGIDYYKASVGISPNIVIDEIGKNDNNERTGYTITSSVYSRLDENINKYVPVNSGVCINNFRTSGILPENTDTVLIIYVKTKNLPILFAYDTELENQIYFEKDGKKYLNIFNLKAAYSHTSYDNEATISRTVQYTDLAPTNIHNDTQFSRSSNAIKFAAEEVLELVEDGKDTRFEYENKYIKGHTCINRTDADYYLKGKDKDYLLMSIKSREPWFMERTKNQYKDLVPYHKEDKNDNERFIEILEEKDSLIGKFLKDEKDDVCKNYNIPYIIESKTDDIIDIVFTNYKATTYSKNYSNINFVFYGNEYMLVYRTERVIANRNIYQENILNWVLLYDIHDGKFDEIVNRFYKSTIYGNDGKPQTEFMNSQINGSSSYCLKGNTVTYNSFDIDKCVISFPNPEIVKQFDIKNPEPTVQEYHSMFYKYKDVYSIPIRNILDIPLTIRYDMT